MFGNTLKKKKRILSVNVPCWYLLSRVFNCRSLRYQETCARNEKLKLRDLLTTLKLFWRK